MGFTIHYIAPVVYDTLPTDKSLSIRTKYLIFSN